jgi:hypothetical protein
MRYRRGNTMFDFLHSAPVGKEMQKIRLIVITVLPSDVPRRISDLRERLSRIGDTTGALAYPAHVSLYYLRGAKWVPLHVFWEKNKECTPLRNVHNHMK